MLDFAQYSYTYTQTSGGSGGAKTVFWLIYLICIVVYIVAGWKIFTKAGQEGWKVLIPIYGTIILLRIVGMSGWYVLLFLVPFVSFIFAVYVAYKLATAFGYGIGMTILEFVFGIGSLIIAFGSAKYLGPDGTDSQTPTNPSNSSPPSSTGTTGTKAPPRPLVQ